MIFLHRQNDLNALTPINIPNINGIELDVRLNDNNDIILSHDLINPNIQYQMLKNYIDKLKNYTIIINVKESGCEEKVMGILGNSFDYYFLDSQIPDIVRLAKQDNYKGKFIIRVSDVEPISYELLRLSSAKYIWIDYTKFNNNEIDEYIIFLNSIAEKINSYIPILVSPDLYLFNLLPLKNMIPFLEYSICTKYPNNWI